MNQNYVKMGQSGLSLKDQGWLEVKIAEGDRQQKVVDPPITNKLCIVCLLVKINKTDSKKACKKVTRHNRDAQ